MAMHARSLYGGQTDRQSQSSGASSPGPKPPWQRLFFPDSVPVTPIFRTEALRACDGPVYELLALICREHVLPWYGQLTRDRTLLQEVGRIAVHVIQQIEQRAAKIDLAEFIAVDLPAVCQRHVEATRKARALQGTLQGGGLSEIQLFHSLQPHVGIDLAEANGKLGIVVPAYLSTLVEEVLILTLPPTDGAAETERIIVREVLIYIVLANTLAKLSQPWFMHQLLLREIRKQKARPAIRQTEPLSLVFLSWLWSCWSIWFSLFAYAVDSVTGSAWKDPPVAVDLTRPSLDLLATFLRARDRGFFGQVIWLVEASTAVFGGTVDSYIRQRFDRHLLNADTLKLILDVARETLFPGGKAAPHLPDPSDAEKAQFAEDVRKAVGDLVPDTLLALMQPDMEPLRRRAILANDVLEPFDNADMNVHLLLSMIDLFIARLFPELLIGT